MLDRLAELERAPARRPAPAAARSTSPATTRAASCCARERIELLVDRDAPFLELSPVAAWGTDYPVGASVVTGIGVVEGVECVIIANDPTVRGGAVNPYTLQEDPAGRRDRAGQPAADDQPGRVRRRRPAHPGGDLHSRAGGVFRDLTRLSAAGIPTVAVVFGNATAGGAYVPGMSDYTIMVRDQAKVFLAGPPLVKMATGEETDDESLGGAAMHAHPSRPGRLRRRGRARRDPAGPRSAYAG